VDTRFPIVSRYLEGNPTRLPCSTRPYLYHPFTSTLTLTTSIIVITSKILCTTPTYLLPNTRIFPQPTAFSKRSPLRFRVADAHKIEPRRLAPNIHPELVVPPLTGWVACGDAPFRLCSKLRWRCVDLVAVVACCLLRLRHSPCPVCYLCTLSENSHSGYAHVPTLITKENLPS